MARRQENEPLYKAFREFFDRCLIQNKSLLWPQNEYWTLDNLHSIKKRLIDLPLEGPEKSFEQKLDIQMSAAMQAEWAIICDIYYIYFLPSSHIKFSTKQSDIESAAKKGNLTLPAKHETIWEPFKHGFTRTSMRYHVKYAQFWLIIFFSLSVKTNEDPISAINKPPLIQNLMDTALETLPNRIDRAHDMRHAMLYMAFPENYERIISTRDKSKIVEKYGNLLTDTIPSDLDEKLFIIRTELSKKYDKPDRQFDFYTDLKTEWRNDNVATDDVELFEIPEGQVTVPKSDDKSLGDKEEKEISEHTHIQWLLLKTGNEMGLDLWVAKNDKNRIVDGKSFSEIPRLKTKLPLSFSVAALKTIELIDVLWLKENEIIAAFEIESTTSIYSGILRMADLIAIVPNLKIPLYIVAPDDRKNKVFAEINRPVFSKLSPKMSTICKYISFSSLSSKLKEISSVIKHVSPAFLDDIAEYCEIELEQ
jgi:hypothetical protein